MKWVIFMLLFLSAYSFGPVKEDPWYGMAPLRYEAYIRYAQDEQVRAIQRQYTEDLYKFLLAH